MRFKLCLQALLLTIIALGSCHSSKKLATPIPSNSAILPQIKVSSGKAGLRTTTPVLFDIIHTEIDIEPLWATHQIKGVVTHTIKNFRTDIDSITLDAKAMTINRVTVNSKLVSYKNTGKFLFIRHAAKPNDSITLQIEYVANPDAKPKGGSASISSDKGFYFINTKRLDRYKPMQAWTQGETEANSCWFPTVDKPNYKSTFTIKVLVPDSLTTLSNGSLELKNKRANNMRQDVWQQTKPMSAYLVMLAIGNYTAVKAAEYPWKNPQLKSKPLLVDYHVEPQYSSNAQKIFEHTPEMIDFFSTKLGYTYPWAKYSQVTARDYVSGAMENTSASLFGEFVQMDERGSLDQSNEGIVAHELFHQWFGDVVTCESWSHLTLNEGFASYGEYLWHEYKYGKEAAEVKIQGDLASYLRFSKGTDHAPVYFYYADKEDMFNAIIYRKGARILHLLRHELGDSAFFKGISHYLHQHEYRAVEIEDLRLAMEYVSGKDLREFWQQWYYTGGHPNLHLRYERSIDSALGNTINIHYQQYNDSNKTYNFPIGFLLVAGKEKKEFNYRIKNNEGTIKIPLNSINVGDAKVHVFADCHNTFIGKITEELTPKDYEERFSLTESYIQKRRIIDTLWKIRDANVESNSVLYQALKDKNYKVRQDVLSVLDTSVRYDQQRLVPILTSIAMHDEDTRNKSLAINYLGSLKQSNLEPMFTEQANARSYAVAGSALQALYKLNQAKAIQIVHQQKYDWNTLTPIHVDLLVSNGVDTCLSYYQEAAARMFTGARSRILWSLTQLYQQDCSEACRAKVFEILSFYALNDENEGVLNSASKAIKALQKFATENPKKVTAEQLKLLADWKK